MTKLSKEDLESISFEGTDLAERLPEKMSALLRVAVADARKLAHDPRYKLDMGLFHAQRENRCHVCMAGAVMACTLKSNPRSPLTPYNFSGLGGRLDSIDSMRTGNFDLTLDDIDCESLVAAAKEAGELVNKHYKSRLGRAPWSIYLQAADILAEAGL